MCDYNIFIIILPIISIEQYYTTYYVWMWMNYTVVHSVYVCAYFSSSGSWFCDHIQFNSAEIDTVWFAFKSGIMLK